MLGQQFSGAGFGLTKAGTGTLVLNGVMGTAAGGVTVNAGTLTLAGANTYSGATTLTAGTLIINPPGTQHSVVSEAGCIVLAIYEKPVEFLGDGG